jgi:FkbM family methyltransferase
VKVVLVKLVTVLKWVLPYGALLLVQKLKAKRLAARQKSQRSSTAFLPVKSITLFLTRTQNRNTASQGGEDLLLRAYSNLDQKKDGFYIDIGSFHPVSGSNTKYFYDLGWSGLNIDPNPDTKADFERLRPRDINLAIGVSDQNSTLDYYYFGPNKSINTFDAVLAKRFAKDFKLEVKEKMKIPVRAINEVLEENLPKNQTIDFLTLDVEGFELRILKAWDFEKYPPSYILVEDINLESPTLNAKDWQALEASEQHQFLVSVGYVFKGKTTLTLLYALG